MMMAMAKAMGRPTSQHAVSTASFFERAESLNRRSTFSTMTMAPSTSMPMAMASPPSDIRLAEIPKYLISTNAKRTEKGTESATTMLGRNPPMKISSTSITRPIPWNRAV